MQNGILTRSDKYCSYCDQILPISEFTKKKSTKDGLQCYCAKCIKIKWRLDHPKDLNINKCQIGAIRRRDNERGFCVLPGYKYCSGCTTILSISEFCKDTGNRDGFSCKCKKCKNKGLHEFRLRKGYILPESTHCVLPGWKECYSCNKILESTISNFTPSQLIGSQRKQCRKCSIKYIQYRMENDINFKIKLKFSSNINRAIKRNCHNKKLNQSQKLLGISIPEIKIYIESQFISDMSWDNRGKCWHLDHIIPCELFDLTYLEAQFLCFNYKNLQVLYAQENEIKNDHLPDGQNARNLPKIKSKQQLLDLIQTWPNPEEFEWVREIEIIPPRQELVVH